MELSRRVHALPQHAVMPCSEIKDWKRIDIGWVKSSMLDEIQPPSLKYYVPQSQTIEVRGGLMHCLFNRTVSILRVGSGDLNFMSINPLLDSYVRPVLEYTTLLRTMYIHTRTVPMAQI